MGKGEKSCSLFTERFFVCDALGVYAMTVDFSLLFLSLRTRHWKGKSAARYHTINRRLNPEVNEDILFQLEIRTPGGPELLSHRGLAAKPQ